MARRNDKLNEDGGGGIGNGTAITIETKEKCKMYSVLSLMGQMFAC